MAISSLQYVLWFAAPLAQLLLYFQIRKRGLQKEFPLVQTFAAFGVLSAVLLFLVFKFLAPVNYFAAYWVQSALAVFLEFAVVYEIFAYSIRPYVGLRGLALLLFRWAAAILLLVSAVMAFSGGHSNTQNMVHEILNMERSIRLVECGLLLFIFMFSAYLGMSWRNFASGVALGLGLFAITDLLIDSLKPQLGPQWNDALSTLLSVMYVVSTLIWVSYSMLPETVNARTKLVYQPTFDRWNQAAMAAVTSRGTMLMVEDHTSLSEIEQAVERVMEQNTK